MASPLSDSPAAAGSASLTSAPSLTLVIGGARSGKSRFGERLVRRQPGPWHYIATAEAFDDEMAERIAAHRRDRGAGWITHEAPHHLAGAVAKVPDGAPLLVDCLTLWLSNRLLADAPLETESAALAACLAAPRGPWVAVSNEVGLSVVPDTKLGRRFRDAQGRLNQTIAEIAGSVIFMVAGLPQVLKGVPPAVD